MGRQKPGKTYQSGQPTDSSNTDVQTDSPLHRLEKINEAASKRVAEILSGLICSLPPDSIVLSGKTGHLYYFYDYLGMTAALIDSFRSTLLADTEQTFPENDGELQSLQGCLDGIAMHLLQEGKNLAAKQVAKSMDQADLDIQGWISAEMLGTLGGKRQKLLKKYLELSIKQTKVRQGLRRPGGSKPKFHLSDLRRQYDELHPICHEAKRLYKQCRQNPRWKQIVTAGFPEMDPDLILQLSLPDPSLPQELVKKIDDQGATSSPGDIALEWAARRCGAPWRQYSISHLKAQLSKSKR